MPLLRKLIALAVTTGVAKKAWDAYRGKPSASDYGRRSSDLPGGRAQAATERRSRPRSGGFKPDAS